MNPNPNPGLERQVASGDFRRRMFRSAEIRPSSADAASLFPEAAQGLADITGEPFRTEIPDPEAVACLGPQLEANAALREAARGVVLSYDAGPAWPAIETLSEVLHELEGRP
jgi:hypothetical protein